MISWIWPYAFALLPLPLIVRWLLPAASSRTGAIRVPFFAELQRLQATASGAPRWRWVIIIMAWLVWAMLVGAVARPTWVGEPVELPTSGRDLLLAVDISGSMSDQDMVYNNRLYSRISSVKTILGEFVQRRVGDRVGLVLFGSNVYLQTPLTFDRNTVDVQLKEAEPGFAGKSTAIGDAIGMSVKILRERPSASRVLVLLTDGTNTSGTNPIAAANIAAEAQIRIHTVGIGADPFRGSNMPQLQRRMFGSSELDEETLTRIARVTGGQYFRARDPQEMQSIYAQIDELEPQPEVTSWRPRRSLFHWPLAASLALSLLLATMQARLLVRAES